MPAAPKVKLKVTEGKQENDDEDEYKPDVDLEESDDVSMDDVVEEDDAKDEEWNQQAELDSADEIDLTLEDDEGSEEDEYDDDEDEDKPRRRRGATTGTRRSKAATGGKPRTRKPSAAAGAKPKAGGSRKPAAIRQKQQQQQTRKRSAGDDLDIDLEENFVSDDEGGAYVLGAEDEEFHDFSDLELKPDHINRPLWVCPDGRIFLETFSPIYKQAYDFLIAVAEPVSRPESIHEYTLTPHSLYAAVSIGLETSVIVSVLDRLSKTRMPAEIRTFIQASTENYGKVKLVLQRNRFFVESPYPYILRMLLKDETVQKAHQEALLANANAANNGGGNATNNNNGDGGDDFVVSRALKDRAAADLAAVEEIDLTGAGNTNEEEDDQQQDEEMLDADQQQQPQQANQNQQQQKKKITMVIDAPAEEDPDRELHSFEIAANQVEHVKARCLPGPDSLSYPMLEEYDFRGDTVNPTVNFELKPHVKHRPYQEKSLSKMFGNSRARSGLIVLPCGAGKSLVGVSAAARIKKSCLCLCTNSVSVDQWKYQFQLWTTLRDDQVCRFTSDKHEWLPGTSGVCITTYTMVAFSGKRSEESEKIMNEIMSREWGLLLLDEVHVVPAQMFRKVIGIVKAHCKLGLTATLVREDQLITDLNFLIGPKLYEANWLDLTKQGHIANVQCAEVWCPMTPEFMREYAKPRTTGSQKQLLYVMNPSKLRACQYLINYHESRGDKIIVFSDNIYALREYAMRLHRVFIYGGTSHGERTRVLRQFKTNPTVNTIFLSKIGDNSLDIPEANVLIQISSHGGSRRQEAQRLGRILRKKKALPGVPSEEFDAFFYTLMSNDTQEEYFTAKRQQFLIDQGYAYKVIPSLLDIAGVESNALALSTKEEQLNVLAAILQASEADAANEVLPVGDDIESKRKNPQTKRVVGSMAALSGARGLRYQEFSTVGGASGSGQRAGRGQGKLAKFRR